MSDSKLKPPIPTQAPNLTRLISVALRGMTLASKFLLIFFLARFLEPAELGLYGLVAATISYALYLLGLDFYTFTTREILKCERKDWGGLLKNQGALTLILYVVFMPFILLVFAAGILPWHVVGWFMVLLVLEHLNQELMRLLIAISDQLAAGVALFLRSGAWAIVIIILMLIDPSMRNFESILAAWAVGGGGAFLFAITRVFRLGIGGWHKRIDWHWVRLGIKVALPLLVATLALRGVYTLDRYWLEALAGLEVLGAYVLFIGIAGAMMSFLEAGIFAFSYPCLITAFQQDRPAEYRRELKRLLGQTLLLAVIFVIIAVLMIGPVLSWLDRPLYIEQQGMFPWILLATFLYALGMIPHYALYAQSQDRPIIHTHISSLIIFIIVTWLFSTLWPDIAIPLGLCVTFFSVLLWKSYAYFRLTPVPYRLLHS